MDVLLSNTEKPQPDILFISKERINIITEMNIKGAPDLVVEILSPSTAANDRTDKSRMYYRHGVREYWIVDPDIQCIEIYVSGETNWNLYQAFNVNEVLTSPLFPGLEIIMKEVFIID
nr:Uma2 family endonuclease [Desulfofarcimen acetoxidans]